MLFTKDLLENVLEYIGKRLKHETKGLFIGGNAMMFYGLKGQTKDADIVFYNKYDITGVKNIILSHPIFRNCKVLHELPYKMDPELLKKGKPLVIGNKDLPRFDIFYRYVFTVDTKSMFEKSKTAIRFGLLKLMLASLEDIIFLKTVSSRPIDISDITRIIKNSKIDWKSFEKIFEKFFKTNYRACWFALGSLYEVNKREKLIPKTTIRKIESLWKK